jgi:hypothetical protein
MSEAPLRIGWETFWIVMATAVFLVWCVAAVLGMSGHRHRKSATSRKGDFADSPPVDAEKHRPGGVIDVFSKNVEEAEGPLPILGWVVLIGVPIWWLSYLILYWNKH